MMVFLSILYWIWRSTWGDLRSFWASQILLTRAANFKNRWPFRKFSCPKLHEARQLISFLISAMATEDSSVPALLRALNLEPPSVKHLQRVRDSYTVDQRFQPVTVQPTPRGDRQGPKGLMKDRQRDDERWPGSPGSWDFRWLGMGWKRLDGLDPGLMWWFKKGYPVYPAMEQLTVWPSDPDPVPKSSEDAPCLVTCNDNVVAATPRVLENSASSVLSLQRLAFQKVTKHLV
jgi:hypothetical protein